MRSFGFRNGRLDRLFVGDVGVEGDALDFGGDLLGVFLVLVDDAAVAAPRPEPPPVMRTATSCNCMVTTFPWAFLLWT
jgi:hypothetical protein